MRYLLVLVATILTAIAQPLQFMVLKEGLLEQRLRLAHPKNAERYRRLKTMFADSGCSGDAYHEQAVKGSKEPNLICAVPAADYSRKIIVGAHFDSVGSDGVIDNWSGAVLLPPLYDFIHSAPRRHQFEFIGFAAEEKGLLGSKTYVRSVPKPDRKQIAAAIVVDSIGLTPTKCWTNGSSKELVSETNRVAQALRLGFAGVNVDGVGTTDSEPFKDAKIPVLCLHSLTTETWRIINSSRDVWAAVSWKDYYDTYTLISALLVHLDQTLP